MIRRFVMSLGGERVISPEAEDYADMLPRRNLAERIGHPMEAMTTGPFPAVMSQEISGSFCDRAKKCQMRLLTNIDIQSYGVFYTDPDWRAVTGDLDAGPAEQTLN